MNVEAFINLQYCGLTLQCCISVCKIKNIFLFYNAKTLIFNKNFRYVDSSL